MSKDIQPLGNLLRKMHSPKSEGEIRGFWKSPAKAKPERLWIHESIVLMPNKDFSLAKKAVLQYLAYRAGRNQVCFTTYPNIARYCGGIAEKTVNESLDYLVDNDYIRILKKVGPRGSNVYIITGKSYGTRIDLFAWGLFTKRLIEFKVTAKTLNYIQPRFYKLAKSKVLNGRYGDNIKDFYSI